MSRKAILLITMAPFLALAQERTPLPKPVGAASELLRIFVLEGTGATNSLLQPSPGMVVVEVRDQNDLPVEGADVTFELPAAGPGGHFSDDQFVKSGKTNSQGQAGVTYLPNDRAGRFDIKVSARSGNRAGQTRIAQSNAMRAPSREEKRGFGKLGGWKWALIIGGAAATAAVVILVTRGGGTSSSSNPTITLSPGTPTFGAP